MLCEPLESRRLMSVSLNPATHVLTLDGTPADDTILVKVVGANLTGTVDGAPFSVPVASVSKIVAYGRQGYDTITLDASVKVNATLYGDGPGTPSAYSPINGDVIHGGSGNDTICGGRNSGFLSGGAGNDTLDAGPGDTGLDGGPGNDRLINGGGENQIDGGPGVDTADYSASTVPVLLGNDLTLVANGFSGGNAGSVSEGDAIENVENFTGGKGNDKIYGDNGANVLKGNGGNDYIKPGLGNDQVFGGAGFDRVDYSDVTVNLRITLDDVANDGPAGGKANVHSDIEQVDGGSGDDYIVGSDADNVLVGGPGRDALFGLGGNDTFFAREGNIDFISGGTGTDKARIDLADSTTGIESFLP